MKPKKFWMLIFFIGIFCMFIYPPWHSLYKGENFNLGYRPINYDWRYDENWIIVKKNASPAAKAHANEANNRTMAASIDYERLAFQVACLAVFCGIGYILHTSRDKH